MRHPCKALGLRTESAIGPISTCDFQLRGRPRDRFPSRLLALLGVATVWVSSLGGGEVRAAETVVLNYGESSSTIALDDLKTLAETGNAPPSLAKLSFVLSRSQKEQILAALQTQLDVDEAVVRNFLDTEMGRRVLGAIAALTPREDVIQLFKLRRALLRSARNPDGLSLIGLIDGYPDEQLELDLERAFLVGDSFNRDFWRTQAFMAAISPQLAGGDSTLELPFDPTQPGNARVRVLSLTLFDRERDRRIPADIYYSAAASPQKPVILFSHGLFSVNEEMIYLAEHLASHGYVVVAPEHPRSNGSYLDRFFDPKKAAVAIAEQVEVLEPTEFLQRPRDISFVLDELKRLNRTSRPLRGKLDPDKALILGYSVGGGTALSLAGAELQLERLKAWCPQRQILASNLGLWAQCRAAGLPENRYQLRDPRIKAAIALSPTTSLLFGDTGLSQIQIPTLIATASADKTTPALSEQIASFPQIPAPKWLVGIIGGTHLSFKDPVTTTDQAGQPDTLYSGGEVVDQQAWEVRRYMKAIVLAMAAQLTDEAEAYQIFLTPEYARVASTERLPFRLVREIPPEVERQIPTFLQGRE